MNGFENKSSRHRRKTKNEGEKKRNQSPLRARHTTHTQTQTQVPCSKTGHRATRSTQCPHAVDVTCRIVIRFRTHKIVESNIASGWTPASLTALSSNSPV